MDSYGQRGAGRRLIIDLVSAFSRSLLCSCVAFSLLLFASACDQTFEPLIEHDRYFSIFGVLNPAADTQWIRVTPIRDLLTTSTLPGPIEAVVTLEDLSTGQIVTLSDSLFAYGVTNLDHSQHRYAYNFWTTHPIRPGATYRLTVTRSDGTKSSATVPMAKEYPTNRGRHWPGPEQVDEPGLCSS